MQNGSTRQQQLRQHTADGPSSIPVLSRLCAAPASADVAKSQLQIFEGEAPCR